MHKCFPSYTVRANCIIPHTCVYGRSAILFSEVRIAGLESYTEDFMNASYQNHCPHCVVMLVSVFVSWCGGELWVDQRKKCADIFDVAQVTDIRTLPN